MVKLTKASVEKMAAEMPSTNESNPQAMPQNAAGSAYTLSQFYELYTTGGWTGGYVISFGREIGPNPNFQYIDDVIYIDGFDCDGNPCPVIDESGELGGDTNDSGDITGDENYVYPLSEYFYMVENETWKGGYVMGLGYVSAVATVTPQNNAEFDVLRGTIVGLARSYEGVSEMNNPQLIEQWLRQSGANPATVTTPWCAAFVNSVVKGCGLDGPTIGPASVNAWRHWGKATSTPLPGDIAIWNKNGWSHVGIVAESDGVRVKVISGNYSAKVTITGWEANSGFIFRTF